MLGIDTASIDYGPSTDPADGVGPFETGARIDDVAAPGRHVADLMPVMGPHDNGPVESFQVLGVVRRSNGSPAAGKGQGGVQLRVHVHGPAELLEMVSGFPAFGRDGASCCMTVSNGRREKPAVSGWSPVATSTRTPAARSCSTGRCAPCPATSPCTARARPACSEASSAAPVSGTPSKRRISKWPIVAIHAALLPTGKVMFFSYPTYPGRPNNAEAYLWDPANPTAPPVATTKVVTSAARDTDLAVSFIFDTFTERHPPRVTGGMGRTGLPVRHRRVAGMRHGQLFEGPYFAVYGEGGGKGTVAQWQRAMGIHWTDVRREIAEAIPPSYSGYLGRQMIEQVGDAARELRVGGRRDVGEQRAHLGAHLADEHEEVVVHRDHAEHADVGREAPEGIGEVLEVLGDATRGGDWAAVELHVHELHVVVRDAGGVGHQQVPRGFRGAHQAGPHVPARVAGGGLLGQRLRGDLTQRTVVVEDVEAASERGHHDVALALLDVHVTDLRRRHAAADEGPARTAVE